MKRIGVYIHIPFCTRKCNYCDFCSFTDSGENIMNEYTDELCRRIEAFANSNGKMLADTVYFGGGTPTLLPTECFGRIMSALKSSFEIAEDAEITVECNPATVDYDGLRALRQLGINRISIGLQSANDKELLRLGRLHSFGDFCECFDYSRRAGFDNISLDLMYGIPDQTLESFAATLREVCRLGAEHISVYGLKIEDGTPFAKNIGELSLPDEDEEYEMYSSCCTALEENGYHRYEISNFARLGKESRHNLKYWRLEDYVGFGVAAHSCFGGERTGNSRDISAFLSHEDITVERERISEVEGLCEYVMLGLRLAEGISLLEYRKKSGREFKTDFPKTDEYIRHGFMSESDGRISFTTKGFFVSNTILSEMF